MLSNSIAKLVQYGIESGLTPECERSYTIFFLMFFTRMNLQSRKKNRLM